MHPTAQHGSAHTGMHGSHPPSPNGKLLRLTSVMQMVSLGKSSVYAFVKDGSFPAPVRLGARAVAWRESDVQRWIAERVQTGGAA